ncbi:hypothetical protein LZ012_07985 [Dechloromonas sp. XY25]|uniref:Lipoprotein n=1 Tax=Dechloromonas hankyongensis TaxID=2908002 RepID=A0ABS9K190_9RHOO|nr:hypothetical protein [Dechloromonas hankyongensis]MCG2576932.1 hypothetical protein [Dechloromonas hankyongensis]
MLKKLSKLVLSIFCVLITACATTTHIPLDQEVRLKTKSVSINESVPLPDTVFFHGMKQALTGAIAGPIVGGVAKEVVFDDKTILKNILQTSEIQVGEILRSGFEAQLEQSNIFPKLVRNGADAQFNISITNYGLFKKGAFDGALRAVIWGNLSLVNTSGKILWQKAIKPEAFENRLPAYDLAYYQEHPEALRDGFKALSDIIAIELINDLKR